MPESIPQDLRYAENLRREGRFQEALEVIDSMEKKGGLISADQLSLLILKGKILNSFQQHMETIRIGELAYNLSQSLGRTNETITSLLFKANSLFLGQYDKALKNLTEAENVILINPIESFLICYVIKGQSYLGLQKLNRFSRAIKENTEIWKSLTRAVKTGEVLEMNNPSSLGDVVKEIFI